MASFCTGCGNSITPEDKFCRVCGRVTSAGLAGMPATNAPTAPAGSAETSGKAIGSLICGLFFIFTPLAIAAVIFGHLSLSEIRKSAGRLKGNGMAITGLVLGYAGLAILPVLIIAAIAIPNLLRARMAANESSAVASLRTLNVAEINYSQAHPATGYTCSLSDLNQSIEGSLASGRKNGYVFELEGCAAGPEGGASVKYEVMAYPAVGNQTGVRVFCSDESGLIKVDSGGSSRGCVENGSALQ
jgi:type IV pilus assembly protein PilA